MDWREYNFSYIYGDRDYIDFSRLGQFIWNPVVFPRIYAILCHNYRRDPCQNALTLIQELIGAIAKNQQVVQRQANRHSSFQSTSLNVRFYAHFHAT